MRRRPRRKKLLPRTLREFRQPRSSFLVSRRRVRIKISARQRTRAIRTPTRSSRSTRARARDRAKAAHRDLGLLPARVEAKVKTKLGTHPEAIARAQAPGKVKLGKDPAPQQEREKVETNRGK